MLHFGVMYRATTLGLDQEIAMDMSYKMRTSKTGSIFIALQPSRLLRWARLKPLITQYLLGLGWDTGVEWVPDAPAMFFRPPHDGQEGLWCNTVMELRLTF